MDSKEPLRSCGLNEAREFDQAAGVPGDAVGSIFDTLTLRQGSRSESWVSSTDSTFSAAWKCRLINSWFTPGETL